VFLREQPGLEWTGGAGARGFGRALVPVAEVSRLDRWRAQALATDWVPDLGAQIGSRDWWRGVLTCLLLLGLAYALAPGWPRPIVGSVPAPLDDSLWEEARTQAIAPLAWGSTTGRRMAAGDLVRPLADTPERPIVELVATLGDGDSFGEALQRAGVGRGDAARAADLVAGAVALGDLKPGTRLDLTLGRRPDRSVARPLERLRFRARFDLNLSLQRADGGLAMIRQPIAIDRTPLRIQGLVGASLYRSARAAGAPARAVEAYIKAIASRVSIGSDVTAADTFDLVIEQARAATGEVQLGALLFAGLDRGRGKVQLVRWRQDGREDWYDAAGEVRRSGFMGAPVSGRVTSSFGMRMHPLLGFLRMHKGIDIAAPYGTPIYAVLDGTVASAGRNAGYGNFVKLAHASGLSSGYGHMSRIAVRPGARVGRGQVIGWVGSTGLSTGPHLHWEVWRNGVSVNPRSISFASVQALSGDAMRAFKARVAALLAVKPGAR
jgi:murein DD-endopeptidase MepM/ murein hydrolase activator NlpD